MVSSFLKKFNSQSFLRNWLCIKMGMKKADQLLIESIGYVLYCKIF